MKCKKCDIVNAQDALYCRGCGAKLNPKKNMGYLAVIATLSIAVIFLMTMVGVERNSRTHEPASDEAKPVKRYINYHEYVDLGLSVKWATCNVGASSPEEYGDYFAWGETSPKSNYTTDNCETHGKTLGNITGDYQYDAARANWGGTWRMPTLSEINELIENCTTKWITRNGVYGRLVTSKKNGNSIFLPAADSRNYRDSPDCGDRGEYWTANPNDYDDAHILSFSEDHFYSIVIVLRKFGLSIRPVSE